MVRGSRREASWATACARPERVRTSGSGHVARQIANSNGSRSLHWCQRDCVELAGHENSKCGLPATTNGSQVYINAADGGVINGLGRRTIYVAKLQH